MFSKCLYIRGKQYLENERSCYETPANFWEWTIENFFSKKNSRGAPPTPPPGAQRFAYEVKVKILTNKSKN